MLDRKEAERFDRLWIGEDETWDADEICAKVMGKINGETSPKKRWRKKSLMVLLAAVIAVMGTISFGAERDWDIQFAELVGAEDVMADLPGGYKEIGVSQTVDDITVTIAKSIGDQKSQWIQMDTNMKWRGMNPEKAYFVDFTVQAKDASYGGMTAEPFEQDGTVSYLIEMMDYEGINQSEMQFYGVTGEGTEFNLHWTNYYAENAVKYHPMKWMKENEDKGISQSCMLYSIDITPISIKVKAWGLPNVLKRDNERATMLQIESIELKSGEVIAVEGYRVAGYNSSGKMEGYLPLIGLASGSEIVSVTIAGTKIAL